MPQKNVNSNEKNVNSNENEVLNVDVFAQLAGENNNEVKSREDIVRELLVLPTVKRLNGLTVKNVVSTVYDTHALLTFVVKEFVLGDTRDNTETDAFGAPLVKVGRTHNVQTSSFAVAGVAKDSPRTAIFATDIVDNPQIANMLFAGSKIDVLLQFVAAGEEYVNPFSSNAAPVVFERDKVIHHILRVELGEVGMDLYHARLMGK